MARTKPTSAEREKVKGQIAKAVRAAKAAAYQDAAVIARTTVGENATDPEVAVATAISEAIEQRANIVWGV
jgi:hypothetical protein